MKNPKKYARNANVSAKASSVSDVLHNQISISINNWLFVFYKSLIRFGIARRQLCSPNENIIVGIIIFHNGTEVCYLLHNSLHIFNSTCQFFAVIQYTLFGE